MGNRERIIDAAVKLMNENGSVVGTTQLADYLSISPGNLYYHFRNREEILLEVLARLQADLDAVLVLAPREHPDARGLAAIFIGGATVLRRYRFFFSSSLELVIKDPVLAERYRAFTLRGIEQVDTILARVLATAASAQRLTAMERKRLAENMWVLWTSWPRYIDVIAGNAAGEQDIVRSHEYLASLLKPYLEPGFFRAVTRHSRALRQGDEPGVEGS